MKCMTFLRCLVTFHCFALFCPIITLFPTRIAIILSGWIWDAARITLYSTLKYNSEICISAPNDWFENDTLDGVFGSESVSLFRFGSGTTNVLFCVFDMKNKMAWFARCWWCCYVFFLLGDLSIQHSFEQPILDPIFVYSTFIALQFQLQFHYIIKSKPNNSCNTFCSCINKKIYNKTHDKLSIYVKITNCRH